MRTFNPEHQDRALLCIDIKGPYNSNNYVTIRRVGGVGNFVMRRFVFKRYLSESVPYKNDYIKMHVASSQT